MNSQVSWNEYEEIDGIINMLVDEWESDNPSGIDEYGDNVDSYRALIEQKDFDLSGEYEWVIDEVTRMMDSVGNDTGVWVVSGRNVGWNGISGGATIEDVWDGGLLLDKILPNTLNTFTVYERNGYLEINNFNHDSRFSGTGGEWYEVYPAHEYEIHENGEFVGYEFAPSAESALASYYGGEPKITYGDGNRATGTITGYDGATISVRAERS